MVAGRRIVLQSKDMHALWVSPRVLQSMGPLPDEVSGGLIVRDASGKPTGTYTCVQGLVKLIRILQASSWTMLRR